MSWPSKETGACSWVPGLGMELSPQFVDTIVKRYIRTTGKTSGIRLFRKGKELGREHFERMFTE